MGVESKRGHAGLDLLSTTMRASSRNLPRPSSKFLDEPPSTLLVTSMVVHLNFPRGTQPSFYLNIASVRRHESLDASALPISPERP